MNSSIDTSCQSCPKKNSTSAFRRNPPSSSCPGAGPSSTSTARAHAPRICVSSRASGSDIPCRCGPWVVPLPAARMPPRAPSSPISASGEVGDRPRDGHPVEAVHDGGQVALAGRDAGTPLTSVTQSSLGVVAEKSWVPSSLRQVFSALDISPSELVPAPAPRHAPARCLSSLPLRTLCSPILTPGFGVDGPQDFL